MNEEKFSPEESLRVIQSMIDKTKDDLSANAPYFLVWGWITFIACTGQFVLKHIFQYEKHYQVWLLIIIGIVYSIVAGIRDDRKRRVKTYVSESMRYLWTGMGITYFVLSMIFTKLGWSMSVFPFFIILYALGTFVSGSILKFRPLIIGGTIAWGLAILAVFLEYDYQMLVAAAAILISYIIPAYLFRTQAKNRK
jgi:hypothetical protein